MSVRFLSPPLRRRVLHPCLAGVLLLGWCVTMAQAAAAKMPPEERTKQLVAALQRYAASADAGAIDATEQELDGLFDFDRLSEDPVAPHRQAFTPSQRAEFIGLFRDLIRYKAMHAGGSLTQGTLRIGAAQNVGKQVQVEVHIRNEEKDIDSHVTFTWEESKAAWRVVDVDLDGSSIVKDYQNQFGRILKKDGVGGLIKRIRTRLDEVRKEQ